MKIGIFLWMKSEDLFLEINTRMKSIVLSFKKWVVGHMTCQNITES